MTDDKKTSSEKRIQELSFLGFKKIFLVLVALVTNWQLYKYVIESPTLTIYLEDSKIESGTHKSLVSLKNGSEAVSSDDVIRPLKINFNEMIDSVESITSEIKVSYLISDKSISIGFDLINKNEEFKFYVYSNSRPEIKAVDCRIKNIQKLQFYDYEKRPSPISRIFKVWLLLIILSLLLFVDSLLVVSKDKELGDIKAFIFTFPLNDKNQEEFINGYENIYKTYRLRVKPNSKFMKEIIRNLFRSFPHTTNKEIDFIKNMANFKTELYTHYRTRTAFVIISPLVIIISTVAIFLNYFYYDIGSLNEHISINQINKIVLIILSFITVIIILFPRRTMNLLFIKRKF
jgi:hypothetical protein